METELAQWLLARSGWSPERQVDHVPLIVELESVGFTVTDALRSSIQNIAGLRIPRPRGWFTRKTKLDDVPNLAFWRSLKEWSWQVDWSESREGSDAYVIRKHTNYLGEVLNHPVLLVGESPWDELVFFVDDRGGLTSRGEEGLLWWGASFEDSIVNFLQIRPRKQIPYPGVDSPL